MGVEKTFWLVLWGFPEMVNNPDKRRTAWDRNGAT